MKKTYAVLLTGIVLCIGVTLSASASEPRQIKLTLDDMFRINPDKIMAKSGESVDFLVYNTGKLPHEFVIGDAKELDEHAKEMQDMNGMSMKNPSANNTNLENEEGVAALDVKPGQSGHLLYHFKKPGVLSFACLYPGHREAGMKGVITIK